MSRQRRELLALQKEDIDLREWTITVLRPGDAGCRKCWKLSSLSRE
jgi:hypothetical protein